MPGIGERARSTPDATAIVEGASATTFAELDRRQRLLAGAFKAAGIGVRDRIAVYASNRRELLEVTTGALRCAVVPVPVHALLTPAEAAYIIEDSGARWLFTDRTIDHFPSLERVVTFGDAYERLLHESEPATLADFMLGRPMHYTSGTTGAPKGVWVDPVGDSKASGISDEFRRLWGLADEDVHLVCSPLTHSAPHRFAGRTLEAGGSVVVQPRFDPAETLAAIELYGISTTFMVPTHLERMLSLEKAALRRHDLSTMRMLVHAGSPIREETKRKIIELFPLGSVWEFYGSTEGQVTRISPEEWLQKPGSVGKPTLGVRVSIVNDEGLEAAPGEVGDIWVAYDSGERFSYWRDRRKTEAAWSDAMFTVGDRGWVDEDGYLFLAGRKNDMIISGGINVYPQEVESALVGHPAVEEAVVYGAPHPEWGQQVCALVVPAYGQPLDPAALTVWLKERLAGYKCPRRIEVVDELPRTPTGKVKRPRPALPDESG
ncbi:MAG: AMP-binding protein [Actinomycetota bacterium]|nr:AMP-binding protein [Actinomycetota bacterium]